MSLSKLLRLLVGTALSIVVAALMALLFARTPMRAVLPLLFIAVLVLLSRRYGVAVSLLGSAFGALIFAHFLFAPVGSLRVESESARASLAWMVLGAVTISYLLYPPASLGGPRH